MPALSNKRHELFCLLLAKGKSRPDAYIEIYGVSDRGMAARSAYRLCKDARIAERIEELTSKTKGRIAVAQVANAIKTGRPTLYRSELNTLAKDLALLGLSDDGIARAMRIPVPTFYDWRERYPGFLRALDEGRLNANGRVASALFKKATGYEVKAEKLFQFRGEVVRGEYVEHIPPDTSAASFWLRNRAPELWKERCEVDVGGSIEHKFAAMTPDERRADARSLADEIRRAIADGTLIEGEVEDVTDAEDITDEPDLGDLV